MLVSGFHDYLKSAFRSADLLNLAIRKSEVRLHVAEFGAYCSSNYTLYYPHLGPTTLGLSSRTRRTTLEGVYGSGVSEGAVNGGA